MRKLLLCLLLMALAAAQAQATHIRAGDISMLRLQGTDPSVLTYRIIVNLYRDGDSEILFEGDLNFGDGSSTVVRADKVSDIAPKIEFWQIVVDHTYPSDGVYQVSYFERNRNEGIRNMNNSVNTPFYIESIFFIDQSLGLNDSPILTIPPIDEATVGQRFIHNPGAFDFQGDSLSYRLTICRQSKGLNVDNYRFPDNTAFSVRKEDGTEPAVFSINPITGDLIWDAPNVPGEYNVAFFVDEWRDGVKIGVVNRDMQIIVRNHENKRPNILLPKDTCIVAGNTLIDTIRATDPDRDFVILTSQNGGIFTLRAPSKPATFNVLDIQPPNGTAKGVFRWETTCLDVQEQPYQATFKAEDNRPPTQRLADLQTWRIKVVGPSPINLTATPDQLNANIRLNWDAYQCGNASKMIIWRRMGSLNLPLDTCVTGVQGYEKIAEVDINTTTYLDEDLKRGANYCYRIHAVYPLPKGGESLRSEEACAFIEGFAPYLLNVSVDTAAGGTDDANGRILVRWTTAEVDPLLFPPPITYSLERAEGFTSNAYATLATALTDTLFRFDQGLNTEDLAYNYRVKVFSQGVLIDSSQSASSVRLTANPRPSAVDLSWEAAVPWNNQDPPYPFHYIYREVPARSGKFVLIDSVNTSSNGFRYTDRGQFNGKELLETEEYCYFVSTYGGYEGNVEAAHPLINFSQKACAAVQDSVPPCPPVLTLAPFDCAPLQQPVPNQQSDCSGISYSNSMTWVQGTGSDCENDDIVSYNVYYSPNYSIADSLQLLASGLTSLAFVHDALQNVAGCYAVTAVDDFGNESDFSNIACIEETCPYYELPNVFTPNDDGSNDTFIPYRCPRFVREVVFVVYNVWGKEVYRSTDNINLDWAGVNAQGKDLPTGVYTYIAEVTFYSLDPNGLKKTIKGNVHLMR